MTTEATPREVGSHAGLGLYPARDHAAQGEHYLRHIDAMTREGLHAKSRIAGELAARDIEIERLRAVVAEFIAAYDEYNGAIGLNGTQEENEALLYRVTYRHGAAWKALRGL